MLGDLSDISTKFASLLNRLFCSGSSDKYFWCLALEHSCHVPEGAPASPRDELREAWNVLRCVAFSTDSAGSIQLTKRPAESIPKLLSISAILPVLLNTYFFASDS